MNRAISEIKNKCRKAFSTDPVDSYIISRTTAWAVAIHALELAEQLENPKKDKKEKAKIVKRIMKLDKTASAPGSGRKISCKYKQKDNLKSLPSDPKLVKKFYKSMLPFTQFLCQGVRKLRKEGVNDENILDIIKDIEWYKTWPPELIDPDKYITGPLIDGEIYSTKHANPRRLRALFLESQKAPHELVFEVLAEMFLIKPNSCRKIIYS